MKILLVLISGGAYKRHSEEVENDFDKYKPQRELTNLILMFYRFAYPSKNYLPKCIDLSS